MSPSGPCCFWSPCLGRCGDEGGPSLTLACLFHQVHACSPLGCGSLGAAMAPGHLSVREMREDERPLVLEMLKVRAGGEAS